MLESAKASSDIFLIFTYKLSKLVSPYLFLQKKDILRDESTRQVEKGSAREDNFAQ